MAIDRMREKIEELKAQRDAIILSHNYQRPEVQRIADFVGDSLELSQKAKEVSQGVIVFCGVHFMAETAALLSPDKTVLMPVLDAGCPMADMIDAGGLQSLRDEHPGAVVVCYVNSTAAVKALSDVCCTSANAHEVVARIDRDREVIFVPDRYLGVQVEKRTGRSLIKWPGYCPTHAKFVVEHIHRARREFSGAPVVVHPESRPEVCEAADAVLSTGGMCRFAAETRASVVIVGTEVGLIDRLERENPEKRFVALDERATCPNMKKTRLENIVAALEELQPRVTVPEPTASSARKAVENMFASGKIS